MRPTGPDGDQLKAKPIPKSRKSDSFAKSLGILREGVEPSRPDAIIAVAHRLPTTNQKTPSQRIDDTIHPTGPCDHKRPGDPRAKSHVRLEYPIHTLHKKSYPA